MTRKQRIDCIDIAKGLGMLAIIWGHINSGYTYTFVYSFHIPLFFFLSGLVFKGEKYKTFKKFAVNKIKTLVVPYLVFSVLTWIVWVAYSFLFHKNVDNYLFPLLQSIIAQGSGGFLVHNVPLWFVSCLLLIEFIYYFIDKQGNDVVSVVICCALAVISYLMEVFSYIFDFTLLPWSMGAAFASSVFYCMGNLFMKHGWFEKTRERAKNKPFIYWIFLVVMTAVLVTGSQLNGRVSVGHESYNNRLLFYFNGFLGTFCVLLFSVLTEKIFSQKLLFWVKWIGLNSLYFMFFENPVKGFVVSVLGKIIHLSENSISNSFGWSMLAFLISVPVTAGIVKCILLILDIQKNKRKEY